MRIYLHTRNLMRMRARNGEIPWEDPETLRKNGVMASQTYLTLLLMQLVLLRVAVSSSGKTSRSLCGDTLSSHTFLFR